jgi:hypothetical protein
MQSSTAIAFRALVMLVFMICIPMFAIFGKDVPNVLKGLVEGRGLVLGPAPGEANGQKVATPLSSASNPFGEPAPYRAGQDAKSENNGPRNAGNGVAQPFPGASAANPPIQNPPAAGPANTLAQAGPYSGFPSTLASPALAVGQATPNPAEFNATPSASPAADWRVPPPSAALAQPASYQTPPPSSATSPTEFAMRDSFPAASTPGAAPLKSLTQPPPLEPLPSSANPGALPPAGRTAAAAAKPDVGAAVRTEEKFRTAENRLRELGASHYVLETWGQDNYRFACEMAVGSGVNRFFEARDNDPWRAMDAVLRQVEDWRIAQRQ